MTQWLMWFATRPKAEQFKLAALVIADIRRILLS